MLSKKINIIGNIILLSSNLVAMEIIQPCKAERITKSLFDSLLVNPQQVIVDIYRTHDEFAAEVKQKDLDNEKDIVKVVNTVDILTQKYEQKCPIFLFGECRGGDFFPCIFMRSINPFYRKSFEKRVSKQLISKIDEHQNDQIPVTYTSFGCGGALSEMVILTKVLAKKPSACLHVHFIEGNNICYVKIIDYLGRSREIMADQESFKCDDVLLNNYIHDVIPDREKKDANIDALKLQIVNNSIMIQKKYQQGISWLKKTFPNAQLSLSIHDLADSYFDYMDKHNLSQADVFSAADIQDEMSYLRGGPQAYAKLCIKTLEKKPDSYNAWLMEDNKNAQICSISPQEVQGAEKDEINGMTLYFAIEKL